MFFAKTAIFDTFCNFVRFWWHFGFLMVFKSFSYDFHFPGFLGDFHDPLSLEIKTRRKEGKEAEF
jgi:hypothetical protein